MKCHNCDRKAVITLQHGSVCEMHFLNYFEDKVFKTIKKYQLIKPNDSLCVAASGGKDSLTILYLTKKYLKENELENKLFALAVDEGIKDYREHTLIDLKEFCKKYEIELRTVSFKEEFNSTLDEAKSKINDKKPCNICGVWRRYLLNKYAREENATKVITGHNLDDEAQVIIMNIFKANTGLAAQLGPVTGIKEHDLFVQRVKPLYFCTEKETKLYSILKKFQVNFAECPNAQEGYRIQIRDMLNDFEQKYPGTKQGIINSFLEILPLLKNKAAEKENGKLKQCQECGEPATKNICNACKIAEELKCTVIQD